MVTIRDVAREAGVSTATVSRALNDKPSVDPELQRRVRAASERLGYQGNAAARNLRRRSASVWALVISDIGNPFFTALARGVEDVAQDNGYSVILCNADESPEKERQYLGIAIQEQVAGMIISPHALRTELPAPLGTTIPVVAVDRRLAAGSDAVLVDSIDGSRRATAHLLESGWSRPACIAGPEDRAASNDRAQGYADAMSAAGLADEMLVERAVPKAEGGRQATAALFDGGDPPDSILVANSVLALGVMQELRDRGLRVGHDVGLVMFDDAPWARFIDPPVSVIALPAYEMGVQSAQILLDRLNGVVGPRRDVVLGCRLVVRESSRRPG